MSVPRITREDLKQRLDGGEPPVVVDVRLKYPYEHSTLVLPGAVRVAPADAATAALPAGRDIVVYDSDPDELVSADVARTLITRGFKACALTGGLPGWIDAKLPTDTKEARRTEPPTPGALKG